MIMTAADMIYIKKAVQSKNNRMYIICVIFSALSAITAALKIGTGVYAVFITLLLNILLILSCEDILTKEISNIALTAGAAAGLVTTFFVPETVFYLNIPRAFIITFILAVISKRTKQSIGMGDVICIGIICLCFNLSDFMACIMTGLFFALIYSFIYIAIKKKNIKSEIALIPFLYIGIIVNILF